MSKTIHIASCDTTEGSSSVEVEFQIDKERYQLFFRSSDALLTKNNEAFLACVILPCMKVGGNLVVDGEVSQQFLSALEKIQDIYYSWDSGLHKIEIDKVRPIIRTKPAENRIGAFFTGGVDSLYTFLKHQSEITDLIYVHGFDIQLSNVSLRKEVSKKIRRFADHFDKNVIEIETNLRELLNPHAEWGTLGHGAALAAVGHLLSADFSRIYISASDTYLIFPDRDNWELGWGWGTHPRLDHLWSSESLEFVHDGCEAGRCKKVSLISEYDIALQTIRVCWENKGNRYNCCECEKCLRTMINLEANRVLESCSTFEDELDLTKISEMKVDANAREFIEESLIALEKEQGNDELIEVLQKILIN